MSRRSSLLLRSDRRGWIASQMDRYLSQQAVEEKLRDIGGSVTSQHADWLNRSFGDFAELTANIESIELHEGDGNSLIDLMVREKNPLHRLKRLVLVNSGVTMDRASRLSHFQLLQHVDLRGNPLNGKVTKLVSALPLLEELQVDPAAVGWWNGMKLKRLLRRRQDAIA